VRRPSKAQREQTSASVLAAARTDRNDDFEPISARSTGFTWVPPLPVAASLDLIGRPRHIGPWRNLRGDEVLIRARATTGSDGKVELKISRVSVIEDGER